ncbi:MAG: FAD-dependent oxidoreductase [Halioglobus sp.]|nr:FAD-dependent oxidoreductase [Halioglobus sp.]
MKKITRRDSLKYSATLVAGATVAACSSPEQERTEENTSTQRAIYEAGEVPIENSGWTAYHGVLPGYLSLKDDISADVVIVGAGLAGCSLALHLAEVGVHAVVLEKHQPGWGASGRNAGHVLPTLRDTNYIQQFPDGGKAFFELFQEHHTIPFDLAKKYNINCDAQQTGYLNAITRESVFKSQQNEAGFWQQQGQQVDFLGSTEMEQATGSSYYSYGVRYNSGGRVNPYLFSNGMLSAAVAHGAKAYGDCEALELLKHNQQWRVRTAEGSVTAARVVFCTNAYASGAAQALIGSCYPMTAYALCTKPLPADLADSIMPSRSTLAQAPLDLHPLVIDEHNRIITASMPSTSQPENGQWHFNNHLAWLQRTWPQLKSTNLELEHYWTGRVAMRDHEFPGAYQIDNGVYGLMYFNAWGNVMAPLMAKAFAEGLAKENMQKLPFPLEKPQQVANPKKQSLIIRSLLIPAARFGQRIGIL